MLGWTHYQQKQHDEALAQFTAQVERYPSGSLYADGLFMKGECLFKLAKYDQALPVLVSASETGKLSEKVQPLVLLHAGQSAAQAKKWQDSLKYLAAVVDQFKTSPYVTEARYEMGWAKKNLGELDEALKDFEVAATADLRGEVGARARFMIGEVYFEKKNFEEASRHYQRAMYGYGGDAAPPEVKNWQAKSGFSAARCAEVQTQAAQDPRKKTEHLTDAKRFYTFVVQKHPMSELAPDARKRLEALGKL
jgi:TolA-binding protein